MRFGRRAVAWLILCLACGGGSGGTTETHPTETTPTSPTAPLPAVSRVDAEPPGANCAAGGQAVRVGLDLDGNGALDDGEVTSVQYLCDEPARTLLVTTRAEPAGEHCQVGGTAVLSGLDRDGDGALAEAEVDRTTYVCADALPPVKVKTTILAPDSTCRMGGTRIESGPDRNGNGALDAEEVAQVQEVCGANVLVKTDWQWRAEGCPATATRVRSGADVDGDGVLSDAEVTSVAAVCSAETLGYTVQSEDDLEYLIQNVSVVRGNLIIESPSLTVASIVHVVVTGSIVIRNCPLLQSASIWPAMVGRDIEVSQTPVLESLSVNVNPDYGSQPPLPLLGNLSVTDAPKLEWIDLEEVPSIEGSFTLRRAGVQYVFAADLRHRSGLTSIGGDLTIAECDGLRELDSMLTHLGGSLVLRGNAAPFDRGGFSLNVTSIGDRSRYGGDLVVADNTALSGVYLDKLSSVTGDVYVSGNPQLGGFVHPSLATVGENYMAADNASLSALGGLPPAASELTVGGTVRVERNAALASMPAFTNLIRAGSVEVRDNPSLRWTDLTKLGSAATVLFERNDALEFLGPSGVDLPLPFIDSLVHLAYCDSLYLRDNPSLARLQLPALRRVDELVVQGSPRLPSCQVQAVITQGHPKTVEVTGTDDAATCP